MSKTLKSAPTDSAPNPQERNGPGGRRRNGRRLSRLDCPPGGGVEGRRRTSGPVFRRIRRGNHLTDQRLTAQAICTLAKDHAAKLGLDPKQYGAHSMQAGFRTSAAVKGANLFEMMDVSRHTSLDTLKGYVGRPTPSSTMPAPVFAEGSSEQCGFF
jgi:hypothetical protein